MPSSLSLSLSSSTATSTSTNPAAAPILPYVGQFLPSHPTSIPISLSAPYIGNNTVGGISIQDAYSFHTESQFLQSSGMMKRCFSSVCVFCSHPESTLLVEDGSFRQCNRCRRQFKAVIQHP